MAITWRQSRSVRRRIRRHNFERARDLPHFQIRYKLEGSSPSPTDLLAPWQGESTWTAPTTVLTAAELAEIVAKHRAGQTLAQAIRTTQPTPHPTSGTHQQ